MKRRTVMAAVSAAVLASTPLAVSVTAPAQAANGPTVTDGCLTSVPDPGTTAPVEICYTLFKPASASTSKKVPMLMHSHGWGGSRSTSAADFTKFLDAGYGVLSFDQRGFGESGGKAYVENPTVEGHDVRALVTLVSKLSWVRQDGPGDPRIGAIGGSYGGGYQFLAAFEELRVTGKQIFDALAPEITWNDLRTSLAPNDVTRGEWALALSAASLPSQALPQEVYEALVEGVATGNWPDGSGPTAKNLDKFFAKNGPSWHVAQGRKLDIPVLFGQGTTDSLFDLREGLTNWRTAITDRARRHSIFVGYNGGHVLPSLLPRGLSVSSDPCSEKLGGGSFQDLSLRFFDETLKGKKTGLKGWGRYHLATPAETCTTVDTVAADTVRDAGTIATTTAAGAPLAFEVAKGPIRIAGSPHLVADLTTLVPGSRAFYGLGIGTSPVDAELVQGNVLPINVADAVSGKRTRIDLPAVAVDVPEGKSLFVIASALSDSFVGMGSRTPGAVLLEHTKVHLPVVD